jgi:hypothetical protein
MSHYAKVVKGKVVNVIVADENYIKKMIDNSPGQWIQTSYNTSAGVHSFDQSKALRKNAAGIGYSYDKERDAFIPPKPHDSWVLNETTCLWEPPVAMPTDEKSYKWNEETKQWTEVTNG